jgi:hypothetical protein
MKGAWDTDELNGYEKHLLSMSYACAILYCCNEVGLSLILANMWVKHLAEKHPTSLLAAHVKYIQLTLF